MPKALTKEQEEWAYDKWCMGYSHEEIADALFVSPRTIDKTLCNKDEMLEEICANCPMCKVL